MKPLYLCIFMTFLGAAISSCDDSMPSHRAGGPDDIGTTFNTDSERRREVDHLFENDGTKKAALIVVASDDSPWVLESVGGVEIKPIIDQAYAYELIHVSHNFDDIDSRKYWSEQRAINHWDVSYDQYLQIRNEPLAYTDLIILRRLNITHVPTALVFDRHGTLIDQVNSGFNEDDLKKLLLRDLPQ